MSIFASIASAIFGSAHAPTASPTADSAAAQAAPTVSPAAGSAAVQAGPTAVKPAAAAPAAPATASTAGTAQPMSQADVEAIIARLPGAQGSGYNWKRSIVDLMKLLNLDSSLGARKELAQELGYSGALDGSAEMNVWLHKQVMAELAKSGGQVPQALKHAS
jgi:hypothetical protein